MCGIVGYVGPNNTVDRLVAGLERLEYRGYDSAGVAVLAAPVAVGDQERVGGERHAGGEARVQVRKKSGKLARLREVLETDPLPESTAGIGHTRWATHGAPTDENAHPHLGDGGRLALIHNGIVENFAALRDDVLAAGVTLESETDTEVVAQLLGIAVRETGSLEAAMRATVPRLRGTYTLLAVHESEPGTIVAAKHHSPLVVGFGDGEYFLGSDVAAFVGETRHAAAIDDDRIVVVTPDGVTVTDFEGTPALAEQFEVQWDASSASKGGWSSFMAKEITEQPEAIAHTLAGRLSDDRVDIAELTALGDDVLLNVDRIIIIGCGTAAYAGHTAKYLIEQWARVPVEVQLSHEFRYAEQVVTANTLVISVSQSGETMDTLMAVKHAVSLGARTVSVCNTQSASIPRDSDATVYTHAGPEVAVASTKAFTAQITALALIGLHLARVKGIDHPEAARALAEIPSLVEGAVDTHDDVKLLAGELRDTESVLFLGRHVGFPTALEGALKLKELAYIHAEGFAAGELKHGPIALIAEGQIVVVIVPGHAANRLLHAKVLSNIQEVRARGARVVAIAGAGDAEVEGVAEWVIRVPERGDASHALLEPLVKIVPLQWFALELAAAKGRDVDQPRNLAKSVTVE